METHNAADPFYVLFNPFNESKHCIGQLGIPGLADWAGKKVKGNEANIGKSHQYLAQELDANLTVKKVFINQ